MGKSGMNPNEEFEYMDESVTGRDGFGEAKMGDNSSGPQATGGGGREFGEYTATGE